MALTLAHPVELFYSEFYYRLSFSEKAIFRLLLTFIKFSVDIKTSPSHNPLQFPSWESLDLSKLKDVSLSEFCAAP